MRTRRALVALLLIGAGLVLLAQLVPDVTAIGWFAALTFFAAATLLAVVAPVARRTPAGRTPAGRTPAGRASAGRSRTRGDDETAPAHPFRTRPAPAPRTSPDRGTSRNPG